MNLKNIYLSQLKISFTWNGNGKKYGKKWYLSSREQLFTKYKPLLKHHCFKRDNNNNYYDDHFLNYLPNNSFTKWNKNIIKLIVIFILLALYMNMQKYQLRFYLLIHFSAFEISYVWFQNKIGYQIFREIINSQINYILETAAFGLFPSPSGGGAFGRNRRRQRR